MQTFSITVDRQIYDDTVISNAVYWHTENFLIERKITGNFETITFKAKKKELSDIETEDVLQKINKDLNDYKLRQIISQETKDIRTVLYIKAFANNNDFEEYE